MTKYAVHIAFGLGLAILLGGCGLLLNVAPAGGTPLNQPSSYRAPTLTAVPSPTVVVPTQTAVCVEWEQCDPRWSELQLARMHDCTWLAEEHAKFYDGATEWNQEAAAIYRKAYELNSCPN